MATSLLVTLLLLVWKAPSRIAEFHCEDIKQHRNFHLLPSTDDCGRLSSSNRIMGGENTDLGEFPWMAILLLATNTDKKRAICGGSVITHKYVLTAAHCVFHLQKRRNYNLTVLLGEYDTDKRRDCVEGVCAPPPVEVVVEKLIMNQKHGRRLQIQTDVALLRLSARIQFNKFISPVCLPTTCFMVNHNFSGKSLIVTGWGNTYDVPSRKLHSVLQKVTLTGVSLPSCQTWSSRKISSRQLCVGGSQVGQSDKDACRGDSGGPLVFLNDREGPPVHFVLVGLVSEGQDCRNFTSYRAPGIFSRVGAFMHWILKHIQE